MADKKTHRYRLMLDLDDPIERALSELLDALRPYNNGRSAFQRRALIRYMATLLQSDISDMDNVEEAQLAVQAQMLLKDRAAELRLRPNPIAPSTNQSIQSHSLAAPASEHSARPGEVPAQEPEPSTHNVSQTHSPTPSQTAENRATPRTQPQAADPGGNNAPAKRPASPLKAALAGSM